MTCEKARTGIEIKTMRLFDNCDVAEEKVRETCQGKWFIYAVHQNLTKAPRHLRLPPPPGRQTHHQEVQPLSTDDPHQKTSEAIFSTPPKDAEEAKDRRLAAQLVNFAALYGNKPATVDELRAKLKTIPEDK